MSKNDWDVSYSAIRFFERALTGHKKIEDFERTDDIRFTITKSNFEKITLILVDRYTLGIADVHGIIADFGKVDCIVTSANWNYYTWEAKQYGFDNDIAIFNTSEFFGALWWEKFIEYHQTDEKGRKLYAVRG